MIIATFTANLLAETTYYVPAYAEGKTNRATEQVFQVGGKGLNVAKMLRRLDSDHLAYCFPGGPHGPMCVDWMKEAGYRFEAFTEGCETRPGSVLRAPDREELTVLGLDSVVSEKALRQCIEHADALPRPMVFAICGSIPQWDTPLYNSFREWIANRPSGIHLVVDTYGPALDWFAQQNPDLIKINRVELETLFPADKRAADTESLLQSARYTFGVPRWIITDGGNPLWIKDGDSTPLSFAPRPVPNAYPTGCGDVFFATLLDRLYNQSGYALEPAARLASEYASRNAARRGIADFELD